VKEEQIFILELEEYIEMVGRSLRSAIEEKQVRVPASRPSTAGPLIPFVDLALFSYTYQEHELLRSIAEARENGLATEVDWKVLVEKAEDTLRGLYSDADDGLVQEIHQLRDMGPPTPSSGDPQVSPAAHASQTSARR